MWWWVWGGGPPSLTLAFLVWWRCRGEAKHLADGHKMYLLRKALRTFNKGAVRFNRAEELARKVDRHITRDQVQLSRPPSSLPPAEPLPYALPHNVVKSGSS